MQLSVRCILTAVSALLLSLTTARANNLTLGVVTLVPAAGGCATVSFDLSWENSWRDSENFDAVWLFMKYSLDGGTRWHHATLATAGIDPADTNPGTNSLLEIVVPPDRKGAFMQRKEAGNGTIATSGATLSWDYAADNVSAKAEAIVEVHGIEMIYVPRGPFYVGDSADDLEHDYQQVFYCTYITTNDMTLLANDGSGTHDDPYFNLEGCGRPALVTGNFNANYPNGFDPFYMAKYEMSEGQYTAMLNRLTPQQALNRYPDMANTHRHTITGLITHTGAAFTTRAPDRAASFYYFTDCWIDAAAYVDWAALRPATEMEFEKAARGPLPPVHQEYAWGTTNIGGNYSAILDDATPDERPNNETANMNYNLSSPKGAIRSGAFATNNADRIKAGAGYYGAMDMSGNVFDRVISSGPSRANAAGAAAQWPSFGGQHGDGELDANGDHDAPGWSQNGDHYTGRAGGWSGWSSKSLIETQLRVRRTQTFFYSTSYGGVRAARTAPLFATEGEKQ